MKGIVTCVVAVLVGVVGCRSGERVESHPPVYQPYVAPPTYSVPVPPAPEYGTPTLAPPRELPPAPRPEEIPTPAPAAEAMPDPTTGPELQMQGGVENLAVRRLPPVESEEPRLLPMDLNAEPLAAVRNR